MDVKLNEMMEMNVYNHLDLNILTIAHSYLCSFFLRCKFTQDAVDLLVNLNGFFIRLKKKNKIAFMKKLY